MALRLGEIQEPPARVSVSNVGKLEYQSPQGQAQLQYESAVASDKDTQRRIDEANALYKTMNVVTPDDYTRFYNKIDPSIRPYFQTPAVVTANFQTYVSSQNVLVDAYIADAHKAEEYYDRIISEGGSRANDYRQYRREAIQLYTKLEENRRLLEQGYSAPAVKDYAQGIVDVAHQRWQYNQDQISSGRIPVYETISAGGRNFDQISGFVSGNTASNLPSYTYVDGKIKADKLTEYNAIVARYQAGQQISDTQKQLIGVPTGAELESFRSQTGAIMNVSPTGTSIISEAPMGAKGERVFTGSSGIDRYNVLVGEMNQGNQKAYIADLMRDNPSLRVDQINGSVTKVYELNEQGKIQATYDNLDKYVAVRNARLFMETPSSTPTAQTTHSGDLTKEQFANIFPSYGRTTATQGTTKRETPAISSNRVFLNPLKFTSIVEAGNFKIPDTSQTSNALTSEQRARLNELGWKPLTVPEDVMGLGSKALFEAMTGSLGALGVRGFSEGEIVITSTYPKIKPVEPTGTIKAPTYYPTPSDRIFFSTLSNGQSIGELSSKPSTRFLNSMTNANINTKNIFIQPTNIPAPRELPAITKTFKITSDAVEKTARIATDIALIGVAYGGASGVVKGALSSYFLGSSVATAGKGVESYMAGVSAQKQADIIMSQKDSTGKISPYQQYTANMLLEVANTQKLVGIGEVALGGTLAGVSIFGLRGSLPRYGGEDIMLGDKQIGDVTSKNTENIIRLDSKGVPQGKGVRVVSTQIVSGERVTTYDIPSKIGGNYHYVVKETGKMVGSSENALDIPLFGGRIYRGTLFTPNQIPLKTIYGEAIESGGKEVNYLIPRYAVTPAPPLEVATLAKRFPKLGSIYEDLARPFTKTTISTFTEEIKMGKTRKVAMEDYNIYGDKVRSDGVRVETQAGRASMHEVYDSFAEIETQKKYISDILKPRKLTESVSLTGGERMGTIIPTSNVLKLIDVRTVKGFIPSRGSLFTEEGVDVLIPKLSDIFKGKVSSQEVMAQITGTKLKEGNTLIREEVARGQSVLVNSPKVEIYRKSISESGESTIFMRGFGEEKGISIVTKSEKPIKNIGVEVEKESRKYMREMLAEPILSEKPEKVINFFPESKKASVTKGESFSVSTNKPSSFANLDESTFNNQLNELRQLEDSMIHPTISATFAKGLTTPETNLAGLGAFAGATLSVTRQFSSPVVTTVPKMSNIQQNQFRQLMELKTDLRFKQEITPTIKQSPKIEEIIQTQRVNQQPQELQQILQQELIQINPPVTSPPATGSPPFGGEFPWGVIPWLDNESKKKKGKKRKIKTNPLLTYNFDFTSRALGLAPQRVTPAQAIKKARGITGLELRRPLIITTELKQIMNMNLKKGKKRYPKNPQMKSQFKLKQLKFKSNKTRMKIKTRHKTGKIPKIQTFKQALRNLPQ